jgi:hypothetical protein
MKLYSIGRLERRETWPVKLLFDLPRSLYCSIVLVSPMSRGLLFVAGVLAVVIAASGGVSGAHGGQVTVNTSVTDIDGSPADNAVILIGEDATLNKLRTDELRQLAENNPENLRVVDVDKSGYYNSSFESIEGEAAVALNHQGISRLHYFRGVNQTIEFQLRERRPQVIHGHIGSVSQDEDRAELFVNLVHNGEHPMRNLSVRLVTIPNGWSVSQAQTSGEYFEENRTLHWPTVEPGAEIDSTIVLNLPEDRSVGKHSIKVEAGSDTHNVTASKEIVEVLPEDTAEPTTSPPPGQEDDERTTVAATVAPSTDTSQPKPRVTTSTAPGLGAIAVFAAMLLSVVLLHCRVYGN